MGVKNLWTVLSSTGEVVAIGSAGAPILGSPASDLPGNSCLDGKCHPSGHEERVDEFTALEDKLDNLTITNPTRSPDVSTPSIVEDVGVSLAGQAVAIDLSCWVCDSQANVNMHSVIKPHLRNLVFRTLSLLSVGVLPVFVIEGAPPELKASTMQARNQARGHGRSSSTKQPSRRQFNSVLKECCELFRLLGVPWVQAAGEAEATCAALLYSQTVKAVITEDSDVLLYGGSCVLRNFSVRTNRPTAEFYTLPRIHHKLHLDRNALIALSLLLGCDYLPAGVSGVGVASAIKLVSHWGREGVDALQKFDTWASSARDLTAPRAKFRKNDDMADLEAAIRDRAVRTPGFPFRDVVSEFQRPLVIPQQLKDDLGWGQPLVADFVVWCQQKLGWEGSYAVSKALQFAGRWYACHAPPCPPCFPLQLKLGKVGSNLALCVDSTFEGKENKTPFCSASVRESRRDEFTEIPSIKSSSDITRRALKPANQVAGSNSQFRGSSSGTKPARKQCDFEDDVTCTYESSLLSSSEFPVVNSQSSSVLSDWQSANFTKASKFNPTQERDLHSGDFDLSVFDEADEDCVQ
ncbi:flap endonuclease GEN homolog 1, partial [Hyalella azteca]|uniref:Flap endonuclease GEN homolog 1 n=1 Tax=Hyalella azteca TaxID=294128 RepID=A0A8B7N610_HYAAZ